MSLFDAVRGSPGVFTHIIALLVPGKRGLLHVICCHSEPCFSGFTHFMTARQPIVLRLTIPQLNPMETCVGHQHFIRPEYRPVGYRISVCLGPDTVLTSISYSFAVSSAVGASDDAISGV